MKSQLEALYAKLKQLSDPPPARDAPRSKPPRPADTSPQRAHGNAPVAEVKSPATARQPPTPVRRPALGSSGPGSSADAHKHSTQARLDVVFGLDFGTRFTKLGYRLVGVDRSHIIVPDPAKTESALFRSRLFVDGRAMLVRRRRTKDDIGFDELPYLKLLLKDLKQPAILVPLTLTRIVDATSIKALSAFYLAGVLRAGLVALSQRESSRMQGRRVFYTLNVSLPADHCDDAATGVFREVASVAFQWARAPLGELNGVALQDLIGAYKSELSTTPNDVEVAVFPEIIAALYHFITRRDSPPGVHGFIDIGGGTIDGCVFKLIRERSQSVQVNVLSARVAPLGTVVIAKKALAALLRDVERSIEAEIVTRQDANITVKLPLQKIVGELADFTGQILVSARDKMHGRTLVHDPSAVLDNKSLQRELARSFNIFLTGGGARSGWYRGAVEDVHGDRNLSASNIMRYQCEVLRCPDEFDSSSGLAFERFVIAHGLTMDAANLESLRTRLPAQLAGGTALPEVSPVTIRYSETKDAWT